MRSEDAPGGLGTPRIAEAEEEELKVNLRPENPTVTIIYDNRAGAEGLKSAWGFACLVEGLEKTILFDTGGSGPTLLENMAALGIEPRDIDVVVLSHAHWDHTGGLAAFLDVHNAVTVYLLESFPDEIGDDSRSRGADVVRVSEPAELCPGATLSGEMVGQGGIAEQSLFLSTDSGVAVVTGCAHPGIVSTVERAKETTGRDVLVIIGGFHLFKHSDASIRRVVSRLQELEVRWAGPCHCSGDAAIQRFADAYGDAFLLCRAGSVIPVGELLQAAPSDREER
jgi:7,8-dihydropterin-6-yl-methyl-4-(beta-D-ribofuranosyl)aminobenzene 5'-phosphate synthase